MRTAVIDLGTNTFNLLIAEASIGGGFATLYNEKLPVKLGEGGINKGIITDEAFYRGVQAMSYYADMIRQWKGEKILAFATSAVRNASNGNDFVRTVKEKTGIDIHVINGNQEAEYIARGVSQAVKLGKKHSLVMDIGGGSTEFIILNDSEILWNKVSRSARHVCYSALHLPIRSPQQSKRSLRIISPTSCNRCGKP